MPLFTNQSKAMVMCFPFIHLERQLLKGMIPAFSLRVCSVIYINIYIYSLPFIIHIVYFTIDLCIVYAYQMISLPRNAQVWRCWGQDFKGLVRAMVGDYKAKAWVLASCDFGYHDYPPVLLYIYKRLHEYRKPFVDHVPMLSYWNHGSCVFHIYVCKNPRGSVPSPNVSRREP